jgi:hypothetical protein
VTCYATASCKTTPICNQIGWNGYQAQSIQECLGGLHPAVAEKSIGESKGWETGGAFQEGAGYLLTDEADSVHVFYETNCMHKPDRGKIDLIEVQVEDIASEHETMCCWSDAYPRSVSVHKSLPSDTSPRRCLSISV